MRISNRMIVENAIRYMQENLEALNGLRDRAATGKQFQYASESPEAASAALSLRSSLHTNQAYMATAEVTADWMAANEAALKQMVDLGTRAINVALSGISDSHDAEALQALAVEVDSILQQAIDVGNTQHKGDYIFSGFRTSTAPFTLAAGSPDTVQYDGNEGLMQRSLGPGQTIIANILGGTTFSPLFEALILARDALNAADLSALSSAVTALQGALDTVLEARAINGTRQQQVQASIHQSEETQLMMKRLLSEKEDVSMVEAIAELRNQETIYQAVLEVGRRTLAALNLFDLLR